MFKRANVVMLPTNQKADIGAPNWYLPTSKTLIIDNFTSNLYFLSDDEIDFSKDYVYHIDAAGDKHVILPGTWAPNPKFCNKIIASTDKALKIFIESNHGNYTEHGQGYFKELPQPSQSFIEKYAEEYNKGNAITEVMVEYEDCGSEEWMGSDEDGEPCWREDFQLKINPKDNTITIRKVKDNWSSLEISGLLRLFENKYHNEKFKLNLDNSERVLFIREFIEENL